MGWKMPVVLSCMFCLMINCLSACFDRISALSAGCGCGIRPVRGTRNFGRQNIFVRQPVQIHIHVHMHLAGTSMCQRCLLPDEIPSAPNSPS